MDALQTKLQEVFGFSDFRPGQREVLERTLAGKHTLAVLPTGSGKSLCYQLAAQMLPGITIVVSPLIALMKDQTDQLARRGIVNATSLSSHLNSSEISARYREIESGKCKLLYIAPERCDSIRFQQFVRSANVSLLVIDEAHCISQWGHDFRPHYRTISKRLPELNQATVLAVTATATPEVQKDIIRALGLPNMERVLGDFDRPNLRLEVIAADHDTKDQHLKDLLNEESGPAIVYCSTRKRTTHVFELLKMLKKSVCLYHAGLTPAQRTSAQNAFLQDQARIVVATVAFGMGIDKPDVRKIIHYNLPGSLESYYQEIGRAGRDGLPAICTLLYTSADVRIQRFFIEQSHPEPEYVFRVYDILRKSPRAIGSHDLATEGKEIATNAALQLLYVQGWVTTTPDGKFIPSKPQIERPQLDFRDAEKRYRLDDARLDTMIQYTSGRSCRRSQILRYFGQSFHPPCNNCDVCNVPQNLCEPLGATSAEGTPESDRLARTILEATAFFSARFGRTLIKDVLLGSERKKILQLDLQKSPFYGRLTQHTGSLIHNWIEQLCNLNLLQSTAEEYPRLIITQAGRHALQSPNLIALEGFTAPEKSSATETADVQEFLRYFEKIRTRTMRVIRTIPPDKLEWSYSEGKFTIGDLIRHIAAIERYMYAENARFLPSRYPGHGTELASGYQNVISFIEKCHSEAVAIFTTLTANDLQKKCTTPNGMPITLWKWLRAMVEHEVHHRGQIYLYLAMLGVSTPPLYGLTSEQVREKSQEL